jgi:ATP-dependent DNA helicase RecG
MASDELFKQNEGKTLEFKVNMSSKARIMRSLVAFANTAGGTLIVGVDDQSREVVGVPDPISAELQMANLISDNIAPRLIPDIQIDAVQGRYLLVVKVGRSPNAPHFIKGEGARKGVYVRVGSTNRLADDTLISELRRSLLHQAYDEIPMKDLADDAVDKSAVVRDFEGIRVIKSKDIENLGLVTSYQGKRVPTVGGCLLYGRDRLSNFPDAWIQVGVFAGLDRTDVIDSAEMVSYLPEAISEVLAFIKRNLARAMYIGEVRRVDRYEIPLTAIREAVINAVVHADYSLRGSPIRVALYVDRLEVDSPGLLPFGLTVEEMQLGVSKIRNRVIARVFKEIGLIEQWGSGVQRMNSICRAANLKAPNYEEIGTSFRVTLFKDRGIESGDSEQALGPVKEGILRYLKKQGSQSTQRIASHIRRSTRTARQHLRELCDLGFVVERGAGSRDPHKVYELAPSRASQFSLL